MSTISDIFTDMDVSPTKDEKISTCKKFRDAVTSISALHKNLQVDERFQTTSPRNPKIFSLDLYRLNGEAMMKEKEDLPRLLSSQAPTPRTTAQDIDLRTVESVQLPHCSESLSNQPSRQ
ncbi:hypothetical protein TNCT_718991 [Trichonephila clavata]|uniref:Uncharacterized protein n=1 Tax=Trichonephila clavata TaxID=2740835 RepID=A0A8X6GCB7_TRICU|nr:hypothetical protein TNCT_718991 [Trichonephila clavata]